MSGKYDDLNKAQLIKLLEKRDRTKKLGLVWERDEIEADAAVDANFVACEIAPELGDNSGVSSRPLPMSTSIRSGRARCGYSLPLR